MIEFDKLEEAYDLAHKTNHSLSTEIRMKLKHVRPATIGAAGRIQGVTPAAIITLPRLMDQAAWS